MELKNQIVSLVLAKEMKKLGLQQESLWYFSYIPDAVEYNLRILNRRDREMAEEQDWETFSAPTVAEMGEILPHNLKDVGALNMTSIGYRDLKWRCGYEAFGEDEIYEDAETLPDAMAKMWLYLSKNKGINSVTGGGK